MGVFAQAASPQTTPTVAPASGGVFAQAAAQQSAPSSQPSMWSKLGSVVNSGLKLIPGVGTVLTAAEAAPTLAQPVKDQFNAGLNEMGQGFNETAGGPIGNPNPLTPLEAGLKVGSGAITALTSPLAPIFAPIGMAINAYSDFASSDKNPFLASENGIYGKGAAGLNNFANSDAGYVSSRLASDLGDTANIAGAAAQLPDSLATARATAAGLKTTPEDAAAAAQARLGAVANDWRAPTVPGKASNPASFRTAGGVLSNNPQIPDFLAQQGLSPYQLMESGRYATADTADALRATAGQLSRDALRPSLQMADYSTPRTPVADIKIGNGLIQAQGRGVTPDDTETIQAKIQSKLDALQRKYPDGMTLTDMHDEGITYNQNGKFSPVGDSATDNNAIANRALGVTLKQAVADKAPADLPVNNFNKYLSQYYKAADYLDALDTKKAPVSLSSKLLYRGASVIGAAVGHGIGGGILGGVGGYLIGGALEHAIENMALPMRYQFLQNLRITNTPAYDAVMSFLKTQQSASLLALPAPSFIPLGPKTPGASSVQSLPAAPGPNGSFLSTPQ